MNKFGLNLHILHLNVSSSVQKELIYFLTQQIEGFKTYLHQDVLIVKIRK